MPSAMPSVRPATVPAWRHRRCPPLIHAVAPTGAAVPSDGEMPLPCCWRSRPNTPHGSRHCQKTSMTAPPPRPSKPSSRSTSTPWPIPTRPEDMDATENDVTNDQNPLASYNPNQRGLLASWRQTRGALIKLDQEQFCQTAAILVLSQTPRGRISPFRVNLNH